MGWIFFKLQHSPESDREASLPFSHLRLSLGADGKQCWTIPLYLQMPPYGNHWGEKAQKAWNCVIFWGTGWLSKRPNRGGSCLVWKNEQLVATTPVLGLESQPYVVLVGCFLGLLLTFAKPYSSLQCTCGRSLVAPAFRVHYKRRNTLGSCLYTLRAGQGQGLLEASCAKTCSYIALNYDGPCPSVPDCMAVEPPGAIR
jgi:hypothetical protein